MNLTEKTILLISSESWNHISVSKHHYATGLAARGNMVYFLNPPSGSNNCKITSFDRVFSVNYTGFIRGLRFFPISLQREIIRRKFKFIQKLCKVQFDIIWSFDNSVFFDFSALPKSVFCISHIVDLNQNFEFAKSAKTADLCLSTTKYIVKKQKSYNQESYNIGHGHMPFNKINSELDISSGAKIKCGYAGNLDIRYIDWKLVEKLIYSFPNVDFHFAGQWNNRANFQQIINRKNFYYHGVLSSEKLNTYYSMMDILILVYKYQEYPEQVANPHKMMEYLASGKMIVANWTEEYKVLNEKSLIKMYKSTEDFMEYFKESIDDLSKWNQRKKTEARLNYANNHTYVKQINRIEQIIEKVLLNKHIPTVDSN